MAISRLVPYQSGIRPPRGAGLIDLGSSKAGGRGSGTALALIPLSGVIRRSGIGSELHLDSTADPDRLGGLLEGRDGRET